MTKNKTLKVDDTPNLSNRAKFKYASKIIQLLLLGMFFTWRQMPLDIYQCEIDPNS